MKIDIGNLAEPVKSRWVLIVIVILVAVAAVILLVLLLNRKKRNAAQAQPQFQPQFQPRFSPQLQDDGDLTVRQPAPLPVNQSAVSPAGGNEATILEGGADQPLMPPDLNTWPQPQPRPQPQPDYRQGTVALRREQPRNEAPRCRLTALSGPLKGRSFPVPQSGVTVGRSPSCDIPFPTDTRGVSGTHCRISVDPQGRVLLTDTRSTYGTYLGDGRRLTPHQPIPVRNGQTFLLAGLDGPAFLLEMQ